MQLSTGICDTSSKRKFLSVIYSTWYSSIIIVDGMSWSASPERNRVGTLTFLISKLLRNYMEQNDKIEYMCICASTHNGACIGNTIGHFQFQVSITNARNYTIIHSILWDCPLHFGLT